MDPHSLPSEASNRALLIGVQLGRAPAWEVRDSLDELGRLARASGLAVAETVVCRMPEPHPGTYIGKGKAAALGDQARGLQAGLLIFDEDLSPAQARNLEKITAARVMDRTQLILDIFALHAHTQEGRLQVELACNQYFLPRLRRMWTHLERQRGSIGLMAGPGEQQIEIDRRRVLERIDRIRAELDRVTRHRRELRRGRRRQGWALISLVGYTNAGKSTLLNHLTGAEVLTRDQLFVTLDPTTRQLALPNHQPALLTDTVGFINKLPHHLVAAFQATLEEVVQADILLHVVDAAHPHADRQIQAVNAVLKDLGVHDKPVIGVLNKMDRLPDPEAWRNTARAFARAVPVSALTGAGLENLREEIADELRLRNEVVHLQIPQADARVMAALRQAGQVLEEDYQADTVLVAARLPDKGMHPFRAYVISAREYQDRVTPRPPAEGEGGA